MRDRLNFIGSHRGHRQEKCFFTCLYASMWESPGLVSVVFFISFFDIQYFVSTQTWGPCSLSSQALTSFPSTPKHVRVLWGSQQKKMPTGLWCGCQSMTTLTLYSCQASLLDWLNESLLGGWGAMLRTMREEEQQREPECHKSSGYLWGSGIEDRRQERRGRMRGCCAI